MHITLLHKYEMMCCKSFACQLSLNYSNLCRKNDCWEHTLFIVRGLTHKYPFCLAYLHIYSSKLHISNPLHLLWTHCAVNPDHFPTFITLITLRSKILKTNTRKKCLVPLLTPSVYFFFQNASKTQKIYQNLLSNLLFIAPLLTAATDDPKLFLNISATKPTGLVFAPAWRLQHPVKTPVMTKTQ